MCKHFIHALVAVFFLLAAQERSAQPSQANAQSKKQNTTAQPISTPVNNPSPQINYAAEAERERQRKDREAKDDALKADQLRQNRIIVKATVWMAVFAGLNLVVAITYAWFARRTLRAIQEQSGHAGKQVEKMQGQLDAMEKQAGIMSDTLVEVRRQAEASEAQMKIANTAMGIAERNTVATEQSARIALEETRPVLTLSAEVMRSDTNPEIFVWFKNSGASKAVVLADFTLSIFGSESFTRQGAFTGYAVYPGLPQLMRIDKVDPRQFDLVVRAGGGELTLKIEGIYEGVGGPYPIDYCSKWITGRDPNMNSIDGKCEEDAVRGQTQTS